MRRSMLNNVVVVVVSVLLLLTLAYPRAEAEMGYEVVVSVDNTTWSIERSTLSCTFEMEGEVKGTGMVMRDTAINNVAGVNAKETTHTRYGKINISEKTTLLSKEGPVVIMTNIKGGNVSTNESVNITTNESVNVTISEAWPTFLSISKTVAYSGDGLSTRERYENNGDIICTSFNAKRLAKVSRLDTVLLGRRISVEVQPGSVNETLRMSKSTLFVLSSNTTSGASHVGCRSGEGKEKIESSEDYIGNFKIRSMIKMKDKIPLAPPTPTPTPDWLPCPSPEP
jgi:hypothetical protein